MGFLHKLWDETLAGPTPDAGLGKLRKFNSFSTTPSSSSALDLPITRSITLRRTNSDFRSFSSDPASVSDPLSGSTTPRTPLTPSTPGKDLKKFTRRKWSAEASEHSEPTNPTVSYWVMMSALDR